MAESSEEELRLRDPRGVPSFSRVFALLMEAL